MKFIFINFMVRSKAVTRRSKVQSQTMNNLQLQNRRGKIKVARKEGTKKKYLANKVNF